MEEDNLGRRPRPRRGDDPPGPLRRLGRDGGGSGPRWCGMMAREKGHGVSERGMWRERGIMGIRAHSVLRSYGLSFRRTPESSVL
jgi:hypothetical protein